VVGKRDLISLFLSFRPQVLRVVERVVQQKSIHMERDNRDTYIYTLAFILQAAEKVVRKRVISMWKVMRKRDIPSLSLFFTPQVLRVVDKAVCKSDI